MTGPAEPGFADPVRDGQAVFRAVLDATARPGRIHAVTALAQPPAPLHRATAAVLLTLVDAETPLWLDPQAAEARDWIAFHCGAPPADADAAQFAVMSSAPDLAAFGAGSDEEPERSATVILQVDALGEGTPFRLTGPGLERPHTLAVRGLPDGFATQWKANQLMFPRGIDVILCAGDRLTALPRTVAIEAA